MPLILETPDNDIWAEEIKILYQMSIENECGLGEPDIETLNAKGGASSPHI
jgi:hypothetical protein